MMFLLMLAVDTHIAQAAPSVHRAVVADDYQILVTHPLDEAVRSAVEAHAAALHAFKNVMLPVSAKKLALVGFDASVTKALAKLDPALASCAKTTTRNLGVDFTFRGIRRTACSRLDCARQPRKSSRYVACAKLAFLRPM